MNAPQNDRPGIKDATANVINKYPGWTLFCAVVVVLTLIGRIGTC